MDFQWLNQPDNFRQDGDIITVTAGKHTNLFNSASGSFKCNDFPFYYAQVSGDFLIRCKITPDFKNLYDLGSLVVYQDENTWIKFAFENADSGQPSMVSIVTRDFSDDCNGTPILIDGVWMQIVRGDNVFALHYSFDKVNWFLFRIFNLDISSEVMIGISAQAPIGEQCTVHFEGLEILKNPYSNLRELK